MPIVSWFDSCSILENVRASIGISKNCSTTPIKTGLGSLAIRATSSFVSVRPIINITQDSKGTMAPLNAAKGAFAMKAISEISSAQRGNRLLNRVSMLYLMGSGKD